MLSAGNRVLIVSKPRLECTRRVCDLVTGGAGGGLPAGDGSWRNQVLFRFTIGALDDDILRFWEPNAPAFAERLDCLTLPRSMGLETSVSCEPLLQPWKVRELVDRLAPHVTRSIWIGKANRLLARTRGLLPPDYTEIIRLESWQTGARVREIYEQLRDYPLIRWKESYKTALGLDLPERPGLDE